MLEALFTLLYSLLAYNPGQISEAEIQEVRNLTAQLIAENRITSEELARINSLVQQIEDKNDIIIWTDN